MRTILLLLAISVSACAQNVTVQDAWYKPVNGTMTATWPGFVLPSGITIAAGSKTTNVSAGSFNIKLWPSQYAVTSAGGAGFSYSITVVSPTATITDTWVIPDLADGKSVLLRDVHNVGSVGGTGSGASSTSQLLDGAGSINIPGRDTFTVAFATGTNFPCTDPTTGLVTNYFINTSVTGALGAASTSGAGQASVYVDCNNSGAMTVATQGITQGGSTLVLAGAVFGSSTVGTVPKGGIPLAKFTSGNASADKWDANGYTDLRAFIDSPPPCVVPGANLVANGCMGVGIDPAFTAGGTINVTGKGSVWIPVDMDGVMGNGVADFTGTNTAPYYTEWVPKANILLKKIALESAGSTATSGWTTVGVMNSSCTLLGSATPQVISSAVVGTFFTFNFATAIPITAGNVYYVGFASENASINWWQLGNGQYHNFMNAESNKRVFTGGTAATGAASSSFALPGSCGTPTANTREPIAMLALP